LPLQLQAFRHVILGRVTILDGDEPKPDSRVFLLHHMLHLENVLHVHRFEHVHLDKDFADELPFGTLLHFLSHQRTRELRLGYQLRANGNRAEQLSIFGVHTSVLYFSEG
ncbi:MAG: hypothetical protein QF437_26515, partial [Planctomycetota bacterium]|nr:hypothetical protein [Planctomycetota bacterium]